MKGIVFDRNRAGESPNEWDGQFVIAAMESPGVEVSYQTTFQAQGDGKAVWTPFSKNGRLANDTKSWVSDKEKLAGAIALRFTLQPGEKKIIPMVLAWDFPLSFSSEKAGDGIAATPTSMEHRERTHGQSHATASCTPLIGAKPSTNGRRPMSTMKQNPSGTGACSSTSFTS
jgi:Predicted bile acid beta-glucosidase